MAGTRTQNEVRKNSKLDIRSKRERETKMGRRLAAEKRQIVWKYVHRTALNRQS